jgi:3-mercaptopyruvate sulfurtransferase SseA
VARELMKTGHIEVMVLKGGFPAWEKTGYPMEPK